VKKLPEGWSTGTIQDFLELTDEEMAEIEDRVDLALARGALADPEDERVSWVEVEEELGLVWCDEVRAELGLDDDE